MTSLCSLYIIFVSVFATGYGRRFNLDSVPVNRCPAERNDPWSYRGFNGPPFWGLTFPACYGRQQSPISIVSKNAIKSDNLAPLTLNNYDVPISAGTIENDGHTIQVNPADGVSRTISVNGEEFFLQQFHFHWGNVSYRGSEHILDGTQYTMEMHLVHTSENGQISVVGVLFDEKEDDNDELQKIIDQFPEVRYKGDETALASIINLNNLLPSNPTSYYRYMGSLTTPPCTEGVIWSVVPEPIPVGRAQMKHFRNDLYSVQKKDAQETCKLVNNYRPVQPLYGRKVYFVNKQ